MDKYAVFGNPVKHSKSPLIHSEFAKNTNEAVSYEAISPALDTFKQGIIAFREIGGKGCNVTVPFKEEAYALADHISERAKLAGAANTLIFNDDGSISADNTDGAGLVLDLQNNEVPLKEKRILIIGAGGAARGVIKPLLDCEPASIVICNRTHRKATILAERFSEFGNIQAVPVEELKFESNFDLIINSTSASLTGDLPPVSAGIFKGCAFAYDMAYGNELTCFINWALEHGVNTAIDGLGMLVGQAAESFYIWRNKKPEITPVLTLLRKQL